MAAAAPELPVVLADGAFDRLYRRYVKDVYHYALALLRNPADAEDVTQTTFMNAYRALKRGETIEKPQNWLIKIAHNAARSRHARVQRRVREVPLDEHLEQLAIPEEEKPDVQAILDALGRLPLNQRAALVLRELEGRTYAEIADTLGVSVSAVETLIFRARRSLRLRASAIRGLAIVPLPTSLAQLLEAGTTAVVGGGAVVGSGFLLKAAVAIVAGVVATGVASDHRTRSTVLAAGPFAPGLGMPAREQALPERRASALASSVRATATKSAAAEATAAVVTSRRSLPPDDVVVARPTPASAQPQAPPPQHSAAPVATATTSAAVESVAAPARALPSDPVTVPALPALPVQLPPPPPLPGLP